MKSENKLFKRPDKISKISHAYDVVLIILPFLQFITPGQ